jgi:hypothetical protein
MKYSRFAAAGLLLLALAATPAFGQAGCCDLPDVRSQQAQVALQIIWIPGPFPIPIPIPKGCYQTDDADGCAALGGTFSQLGVCSGGMCHLTAASVPADSLFAPQPAPALCPAPAELADLALTVG